MALHSASSTGVFDTLLPPERRTAAAVAGIRTSWQVLRGTGTIATLGGVTLSAAGLGSIDWQTFALTCGAVLLSAITAGVVAAGDVLTGGLPAVYSK